jgi:serine O-acetyltransferase
MLNVYYLYRIANFLYLKKVPFFPKLIKLIIFLIYNSVIPFETKISKGTRFGYGGIGIVIHKNAIIGNNCFISHQVTIGGKTGYSKVPIIGDNVIIGSGAKIIGPVSIGNNVQIGANAVVVKDIPDNKIAAGIPAKIIK